MENRMMLTSACCKEAWHFVRRSCSINLENFKHDKNGCRKTSVVTLFPPAKAEGHQNPMFYHLGYFDCFKANLFRRFVKFYSYMQFWIHWIIVQVTDVHNFYDALYNIQTWKYKKAVGKKKAIQNLHIFRYLNTFESTSCVVVNSWNTVLAELFS